MVRRKLGVRGGASASSLHFANRNARIGAGGGGHSHSAADGTDAGKHLELAGARLQAAIEELEAALASTTSPRGRADLHEAIGAIMDTLHLVASAHRTVEGPARRDVEGLPIAAAE